MPIFREIEEGRVVKRPFLQPKPRSGRYGIAAIINVDSTTQTTSHYTVGTRIDGAASIINKNLKLP
jgi:hypothetical protein